MMMLALILALALPILQGQPITRQLSSRWHPTVAIETGLTKLALVAICPAKVDTAGHFFAVDSSGQIAELRFNGDRVWEILRNFSAGEPVVTGCAAAMRPDEIWSLILGTASGKVIEMRPGPMGWSKHEITTATAPLRAIRASEPGPQGPSQVFVIDGNGTITNWYVGGSGRWVQSPLPAVTGGATHVCLDSRQAGLLAAAAGPRGIIYKFAQDSMGRWSGNPWDTMSAGCQDLVPLADPAMRDICILYAGIDGYVRYLFFGRKDDVSSRLPSASGAHHLIGKGNERRFNEFFAMHEGSFCLFEYNPEQADWIRVPIRRIPNPVVSTVFGQARGETWHTIYAATADGKIYEFERDGLEGE